MEHWKRKKRKQVISYCLTQSKCAICSYLCVQSAWSTSQDLWISDTNSSLLVPLRGTQYFIKVWVYIINFVMYHAKHALMYKPYAWDPGAPTCTRISIIYPFISHCSFCSALAIPVQYPLEEVQTSPPWQKGLSHTISSKSHQCKVICARLCCSFILYNDFKAMAIFNCTVW